jgi:threonine 3-dehydrogenase
MKALTKIKAEPGIWMTEVPEPVVSHNDVLIKIKKTAICGTDIHIYNWDEWAKKVVPVPLIIGHEFVGEVVDVGSEVTGFKIGQRVSGEGHISCNYCRNCRAGRRHLCRNNVSIGYMTTGCFAEYFSMPAVNVYPIPDSIPDSQAAILDPFGNATHTALSFNLVGEDVLITGAGPVGMMAVAVARHVGARHIVITDVNEYRLDLAKKMGASLALDVRKNTLKEAMNMLGMTEGFDVGLEMSGNPKAFSDMLVHMNNGGKVALLGFLPQETQIDWNNIIMKGLQIKGIYGREMFETWYKMITMLQSGLNISPVITHEFHVDDYQKAFDTMLSGHSGKIVMRWE